MILGLGPCLVGGGRDVGPVELRGGEFQGIATGLPQGIIVDLLGARIAQPHEMTSHPPRALDRFGSTGADPDWRMRLLDGGRHDGDAFHVVVAAGV